MPQVSAFNGITIWFYFNDHQPPHFHAIHGEHEALIAIDAGFDVIDGSLPGSTLATVRAWATVHRGELETNWAKARAHQGLDAIAPAATR